MRECVGLENPRHENENERGDQSMKRRQFLKAAGLGVAASAVAAPAIAQSMPEIKWRMPASWPKSLDTLWGGCEIMAKAVAEATDNRFQIQTFAAGEIVPGLAIVDAVQNGTVEIGHTASYYYFGKDPTFAFGTSVAFGPNARLNQGWYTLGGGKEVLDEFYKKYNLVSLLAGNTGCQMGGWYRKEINSVDDLKGLKMRIGGFPGRVLQKLGGVPQQIAGGDIYPALEKGTLDACEWVGPYDDEKLGFYKVAKYYYYPGWWEGCGQGHNLSNLGKWNELTKSYPAAIATASGETWEWVLGKYDHGNPAALKRLVAGGALLRPFPEPILEACYKAANEVYAEHSKSNPQFKKLYDSLIAFRGDSYQWMQVAELGYDAFMMRMRTRT